MRRVPRTCLALGILACLLLLGTENHVCAQPGGNFQKVKFETPDGIDLVGTWYPGTKKNAPCVMVLHPLGDDSSKPEWSNLAKALQKAGFAVLLFDFRGHGNSTNISSPQLFGTYNRGLLVRNPNGTTIDFKDYSPKAYTYFVNDIASAKAFLDLKNDAGECNSSALVLIGAETGATLGSIWMNSEWYRFPYEPLKQVGFMIIPEKVDIMNPAGKSIMAAVWLSISGKLGDRTIVIPKTLDKPVRQQATPTVFIFNQKNQIEKALAEGCEEKLKVKNSEQHKFIGASPVNAPANLSGRDLLGGNLNTQGNIVKYLNNLVEDARVNSWVNHDFKRSQYVWLLGNQKIMATPQFAGKTFNFYHFSPFAVTK